MHSNRRTVLAVALATSLGLIAASASAADKNDRKCIDAVAKANQKFAATMLKELAKCREKPSDPSTAECRASLPKIVKAATKREKSIEKKCKSLDPVRAFGYAGCQAPGCKNAAGYQACTACATEGAMARQYRTVGNACGKACIQEGYQSVPEGLEKQCTCVPPCALDPVPARVAFETAPSSGGACGCTLSDSNDTSCSGASKVADLQCGKLLVGGGLSSVPPGPTPDGATTFIQLAVCAGDELIIGPDDGEGPDPRKNCSKGIAHCRGSGAPCVEDFDCCENPDCCKNGDCPILETCDEECFFGPAIGVVNNTAALSACVINALKEDLRGTMNATTGHATTTAELESRTFLTGDLIFGRCRGGPMPGKPCSRGGVTPRGDCAECAGGGNDGEACQDDTTGQCVGGSNAFGSCTSDSDCQVCLGGENDGDPCGDDSDCPGSTCGAPGSCDGNCPGGSCVGLCADDENAQCMGGANAGMACTVAVCESGGNLGLPCTADPICRDGPCGTTTTSVCNAGPNQGDFCDDDGDCPGSTCSTSDCPGGTCTAMGNTPVQACPVCVSGKFNPITDGSSGTCDLGANQGGACSSTNSEGMTIDCAPTEEQFLANLPVTLNNMTTGQATMAADADGTFCNFGFCEGGGRAGEFCNNSAECAGGTCHKTCQGGLDTNGLPLHGTPCENHDQCRGLTNGFCGQNAPGAFIIGDAGGGATVRRIIENGQPAPAPVPVGDVKQTKVGAVFCIPVTPKQEINSAASLPGPGAVALEGTFTVFGRCAGGASAGAYCLDDSACPGGTCG